MEPTWGRVREWMLIYWTCGRFETRRWEQTIRRREFCFRLYIYIYRCARFLLVAFIFVFFSIVAVIYVTRLCSSLHVCCFFRWILSIPEYFLWYLVFLSHHYWELWYWFSTLTVCCCCCLVTRFPCHSSSNECRPSVVWTVVWTVVWPS